MVESTKQMLQSLENEIKLGQAEFEIGEYMTRLTADIISRTEFDSSYEKGKQIFHLLTVLQNLCAQASWHLCFPGGRSVPRCFFLTPFSLAIIFRFYIFLFIFRVVLYIIF